MKRRIVVLFALLGVLCVSWNLLPASGQPPADEPSPPWKAVQAALDQGRVQTAIDQLTPIIEAAQAAENHPEAIKAITLQIALQSSIQSDQPDLRLRLLRQAIDEAPAAMQPVMEAIQARWMWMFFQQHRWQFAQRTAVSPATTATATATASDGGGAGDGHAQDATSDTTPDAAAIDDADLLTWDLTRILRAIDGQFMKSLAEAPALQAIAVDQYREVLTDGNVPDSYRPTLYDILVHHALEFYTAGEQAGSQASFAFVLRADSPIFGNLDDFLAWKPESRDDRNPHLLAIGLYQDLLRFHADDDDPTARLDLDLQRLEFGNDHASGSEKASRYQAALQRFESAHADHPLSATALSRLARLKQQSGDLVTAHQLAHRGLARFPDSQGGASCFNLIGEIESPASAISTERVWNEPWPPIDVQYRNLTKVYFRLVPYDFDEYLRSGGRRPDQRQADSMQALLDLPAIKSWSTDLPATGDYQLRREAVAVPEPQQLRSGAYLLLSSHNEEFTRDNNQLGVAEVWVSRLAVVTRQRPVASDSGDDQAVLGGLVTDARSGQPIAGASVQAWLYRPNSEAAEPLPAVPTDADGLFRLPNRSARDRLTFLVKHGDQQLASSGTYNTYRHPRQRHINSQTQFFTDRAIYRPGQTIRFKGICYQANPHDNLYQTLAGQAVSVLFVDANGEEIETHSFQTNSYGSFQGSVTAPRDRLPGQMQIRVQAGPSGQVGVRVEEYKRPRFEVELKPPAAAARLGATVQVQGQASAYTGAAIDQANVSWRVVREVRFPIWWGWRSPWPIATDSQEIAMGTTQTDSEGIFQVDFTALPAADVPAESEARFQYTVYADVTDSAGETRSSSRVINVGYTALNASLSAQNWIEHGQPTELQVRTSSLDGDGRAASGTLKIHALQQPEQTQRSPLAGYHTPYHSMGVPYGRPAGPDNPLPPEADPNDINRWELGEVVFESQLQTDADGQHTLTAQLPAGVYRAVLKVRDPFGNEVTAMAPMTVLDPAADRLPIHVADFLSIQQSSLQPGDTLQAIWGSGYDTACALIEIEHRGKILKRYWTADRQTQTRIEHPVDESLRGGFTLRITMVRDNRAHLHSQRISVPWQNKELAIRWERFVSKLKPGQEETWTAVISGPDGERAAAELVATLYDASLDTFAPHHWARQLGGFYQDYPRMSSRFENDVRASSPFGDGWKRDYRDSSWIYTRLENPLDKIRGFNHSHYWYWFGGPRSRMMMRGGGVGGLGGGMGAGGMAFAQGEAVGSLAAMADAAPAPAAAPADALEKSTAGPDQAVAENLASADDTGATPPAESPAMDLSGVTARRNLQETAFFFPSVVAGEDGTIRLQFTMPEALTRWQFYGFAHDQQMRSGFLSDTAVTSKQLMVQPNAPRFLREGDLVEFTVKVTNQSPTRQTGSVSLTFADARTTDSVDDQLNQVSGQQAFDIPAGQSQTVSWQIKVADGLNLLTYRAVGSTGRLSDGEEGYLPVLPRRILVSESLPLPIGGQQSKTFQFERLADAAGSESLSHQSLTVQMASNPAWYAVLSLPYLMEYPHQCSEQIFSRLYANSLARHIATSDPRIERVFEQWRGTDALDSPLEKNEDLRAVMLAETPWVRQADSESQARRNVGILFDKNRLDDEISRALNQLSEQQLDDGRWPWFAGGQANDFITLYITTGFGRLRHLGADVDVQPALRALARLDQWAAEQHQRILNRSNPDPDANHLSPTIALYLYGRSFFLSDQPIATEHQAAVDYWTGQAKQYWLDSGHLQSQGHLAIALKRFGDSETATDIMISLKERSVLDEEMGRYWARGPVSPWWYRAPIETQALLIEAFDEVARDAEAVEQCKTWMLKQRQTQNWKTTKATADAVYALLLRGTDLLASDRLVEVTLGDRPLQPQHVEAGTGFYEVRIPAAEIDAAMGKITVSKSDPGVAWGSIHWQYFEDIGEITASGDNPLQLTKRLFIKRNSETGPVLQPLEGPASVGDELVVRLVLRTDRDLEYVHLRDHRGSGTEPVDVLSSYRWREGLGFYQATRDTATDFFIDYMRKGTYVFEYSTRIQLRGQYQTGMAQIQCMYAPEFQSHSESIGLQVE